MDRDCIRVIIEAVPALMAMGGVLKYYAARRHKKERFMLNDIMKYLAPTIKCVGEIHKLCNNVTGPNDNDTIREVSWKIENELSPTAAAANDYDRTKVVSLFGDSFKCTLEELLHIVLEIDCSSSSHTEVPVIAKDIASKCSKVECLWRQIEKRYLKKVCAFRFVGKTEKRNALHEKIKISTPRSPQCG